MTKGVFMKGEKMAHHKILFDRRSYVQIAKDLRYPDSVISKLKEAETERECEKILTNARKGVY